MIEGAPGRYCIVRAKLTFHALHQPNEFSVKNSQEEVGASSAYAAVQVYRQLAWAYLEAGDKPAPAMSCIRALRDLPLEMTQQSVISFLALKALCQLGQLDEAETELLSIVSSSAVSLAICLGSVRLVLSAIAAQMETDSKTVEKSGMAGVKSAVGLIQERFADQASVPVQLVRLLLAQEKVQHNLP